MENAAEDITPLPTLIEFYADWCVPCKSFSSIIESVQKRLSGWMNVLRIDVDKDKESTEEYGVQTVPSIIFLDRNGELVWRFAGVLSETEIIRKADEIIRFY